MIDLFRLIHEHRDKPARTLGDVMSCPRCRKPEPHWKPALQAWQQGKQGPEWECQSCGFRGSLSDLVFRKSAGFGRTFLEIRGIYPSEAVPGSVLLDTLASLTGGPWTTIYLRE